MDSNVTPKEKAKGLPASPGVYIFKDGAGRVIYVGKATNLRNRVSSYFHTREHDPKTAALVSAAEDIDHIETGSDVEALLLESRLVKQYNPKYNSDLKDDKSYPYIEIGREPYPRVAITRDQTRDSLYIGPFISAGDLKQALPVFQRIFKFRTCNLAIIPGEKRFRRPCLLYYIERCSGPCNGKTTKTDYAQQISHFKQFLKGGKKKLIAALTSRMEKAAGKLDFEKAAQLRDEIDAVSNVHRLARMESLREELIHPDIEDGLRLLKKTFNLPRLPRLIDGIDAAAISGREAVGSAVVFADGEPHKASYRHYKIKNAPTRDDQAMIGEVVFRRYRRKAATASPMPDILLLDGGQAQLSSAVKSLTKASALKKVGTVISLAKREEKIFRHEGEPVLLERTSPALKILQHVRDEAHRFAQRYHHILRRKKVIGR